MNNRLTKTADVREENLVQDIFSGGGATRLNPDQVAVVVGNIQVSVRSVQSFCLGFLLDSVAMDALLMLFTFRDEMLCEAYKEMYQHKRGFCARRTSLYLGSGVAKVLFDTSLSAEETMNNSSITSLIADRSFLTHYKVLIPFLFDGEWMCVLIDNSSPLKHDIHFVYAKYVDNSISPSKSDGRCALNLCMTQKIDAILNKCASANTVVLQPTSSSVPAEGIPETPILSCPSKRYFYQDPEATLIPNNCNRTPHGMPSAITVTTDSGVYIAYAMECDYFDAPMFADTEESWSIIRGKFAYWLMCNQLLLE